MKKNKARFSLLFSLLTLPIASYTANTPKKIVFIVGIGRCGSSCLTGVLNIMGLPLGDNLLKPNKINPTGFFEQLDMLRLNKKILKSLGVEYLEGNKTRFIRWNKEPQFNTFKNMIKENLALHFKDQPFFGFKDPRLSMLLPLYTVAAQELGYETKTIIIIRNPEESMASWQEAGSFARLTPEEILRKFTIYLTSMLAHVNKDNNNDYLVIQYEDLLDNAQQEVTRLARFIPELRADTKTRQAITQFIDVGLNHHAQK